MGDVEGHVNEEVATFHSPFSIFHNRAVIALADAGLLDSFGACRPARGNGQRWWIILAQW